jgi:hypothetical protein
MCIVTFAIKPNANLGSTTILMVISQFYKLLNTFLEVILALTTSSGYQPNMSSSWFLYVGSSTSNI